MITMNVFVFLFLNCAEAWLILNVRVLFPLFPSSAAYSKGSIPLYKTPYASREHTQPICNQAIPTGGIGAYESLLLVLTAKSPCEKLLVNGY